MAKGNRGGKGRKVIGSASGTLQIGSDSIEFDGDLNYTSNDTSINPTQRAVLDVWEKKRENSKVEYGNAVGYNGSEYGEVRGGKGSVRTPFYYHDNKGSVFTHIHPRESGMLGGTFSPADFRSWANLGGQTMRAVAKEGTYSISKGSNFDGKGFMTYALASSKNRDSIYQSEFKQIVSDMKAGKISRTQAEALNNKAFNSNMVGLHQDLLDGQKTYGYHYYLEKRQ